MTRPSQRLAIAALLLVLCAAGCGSPPIAPEREAIPSTPLEGAAPLDLDGPYVHEGTGVEFPEHAAGFDRVAPKRYDAEGNDVGIGYRRLDVADGWASRVEVTVYAYPVPLTADRLREMTFDEQFALEVHFATNGREDLRELGRDGWELTFRGHSAEMRALVWTCRDPRVDPVQPVTGLLATTRYGPWCVKVRATFPDATRDECLAAVGDLLLALDLPSPKLDGTSGAAE